MNLQLRRKYYLNKNICNCDVKFKNNFITIDNNRGIVEFNKNYKIIK